MDQIYDLKTLCKCKIVQNYKYYKPELARLPKSLREDINVMALKNNKTYSILDDSDGDYWQTFYMGCPSLYSFDYPSRYNKNGWKPTHEYHYIYLVQLKLYGYNFIRISFIHDMSDVFIEKKADKQTNDEVKNTLLEFLVDFTIDQTAYYNQLSRINYLLDWPILKPAGDQMPINPYI